jgi:hypothetical protein
VVEANGVHSLVRETAGIGFTGGRYEEFLILADVEMTWGHDRDEVMLFFFGEEDYLSYLYWLGEALAEAECELHAYVLMTNHVHLLLTPPARGRHPAAHHVPGTALRPIHQPHPWPYRHPVGQPLQILPDPGRNLPAGLHALHRIEPGTRCHGG